MFALSGGERDCPRVAFATFRAFFLRARLTHDLGIWQHDLFLFYLLLFLLQFYKGPATNCDRCITFPLSVTIPPAFLTLRGRGKYTSWFGFAL
jgi:hypothetical protein